MGLSTVVQQWSSFTSNRNIRALKGNGLSSDAVFCGITAAGAGLFMNLIDAAVGVTADAVAPATGAGGGAGVGDAVVEGIPLELKPISCTPALRRLNDLRPVD